MPLVQIVGATQAMFAEWRAIQLHAGISPLDSHRSLGSNSVSSSHSTLQTDYTCAVDLGFFHNEGLMISYKYWQFVKVLIGWCQPEFSVPEGETDMLLKAVCWVQELRINSVTFLTNSHVPSNAICFICADIETTFLSLVKLLTYSILTL